MKFIKGFLLTFLAIPGFLLILFIPFLSLWTLYHYFPTWGGFISLLLFIISVSTWFGIKHHNGEC